MSVPERAVVHGTDAPATSTAIPESQASRVSLRGSESTGRGGPAVSLGKPSVQGNLACGLG